MTDCFPIQVLWYRFGNIGRLDEKERISPAIRKSCGKGQIKRTAKWPAEYGVSTLSVYEQEGFSADNMPMTTHISRLHRGKHANDSAICADDFSDTKRRLIPRRVTGRNRFINASYAKRSILLSSLRLFPAIYICPNLSTFISASLCLHPSRAPPREESGRGTNTFYRVTRNRTTRFQRERGGNWYRAIIRIRIKMLKQYV